MILKASKSGAVAGSRKFWRGVQFHMGSMKIPYKGRSRNLGHERMGPRTIRGMEKQRMKRLRERKARFSMLKAAVGKVSTALWRAGALPSAAR
eukprot:8915798-Pyramimonas_sp.AAC.1